MDKEMMIRVLERLSNAAGVGFQPQAGLEAKALLSAYCDNVYIDKLGNVIGEISADAEAETIMLEAHIDEVGFIVTSVDEKGFVKVADCGRADPRTLTGAEVTVFATGKSGEITPLFGVFCSIPPHLLKDSNKEQPDTADRAIDVGLSAEQAQELIKAGDFVGFRPNFTVLNDENGLVVGKSMDDRAGVATILACLEFLKQEKITPKYNVKVVFAVQEELGCRGSKTAAFALQPDYAVAVDVSFAHTPDADPNKCGKLGEGPMIGHAPTLDGGLTAQLLKLAEAGGIPFQYEVMSGDTGTDADSIGDSGHGIKTALLSVPLRYMHTPNEVVSVHDVINTGKLMARLI